MSPLTWGSSPTGCPNGVARLGETRRQSADVRLRLCLLALPQCGERNELVDRSQLVASTVCERNLIVTNSKPVAFDAREASVEPSVGSLEGSLR